jgi:hypothetical protein
MTTLGARKMTLCRALILRRTFGAAHQQLKASNTRPALSLTADRLLAGRLITDRFSADSLAHWRPLAPNRSENAPKAGRLDGQS